MNLEVLDLLEEVKMPKRDFKDPDYHLSFDKTVKKI